ncbi:MAG: S8 family serine peptidase, partial [Lachnospiraceae bacterium]|nr:S8 family serine peptidase [Lachnospiraceae bacterium]
GPGRDLTITNLLNPLKKPDIVAPGTDIISCSYHYGTKLYIAKSGTSMSAPIVSGACALCLQKYPQLTNKELRRLLLGSAADLGQSWSVQGAGMLQIDRLFAQAELLY